MIKPWPPVQKKTTKKTITNPRLHKCCWSSDFDFAGLRPFICMEGVELLKPSNEIKSYDYHTCVKNSLLDDLLLPYFDAIINFLSKK